MKDKKITVPKGIKESIPKKLTLNDHVNSFVISDLHAPQHDKDLLDMMLELANQLDIKRLIIAGDALNLGWASSFLGRTAYTPEELEVEFEVCQKLFEAFLQQFDQIVIVGGNHDEGRFSKMIGGQVEFARLLRMVLGDNVVNNMKITSRRYCEIRTPSGPWRITHQGGKGRKRQLSTVEELASVKRKHCLMGHEHTLGMVVERTGKYWAVSSGHACDASLMEYKNKMDSLHTSWASGFVQINEDGIPSLWRKTDLKRYLSK